MTVAVDRSARREAPPAGTRKIQFEEGLPGFPDARVFYLHGVAEREGWFRLVGAGGSPAFLVVDPFLVVPRYKVELPDDKLPGAKPEDVLVLAIVRVPDDPLQATVNLRAPLVIDLGQGRGLQWVPAESAYSLRHPLFQPPRAGGV